MCRVKSTGRMCRRLVGGNYRGTST
ncbi:hypothetical protein CcCBS67573_g09080 [Chytriomyces confervae]|uniref:Uncharacterized protein n=1 Tax=Chytriomyces confervae TaxID=246404 RepID=A0A507E6P3_9FUNG|nr:hypothetical protein CcCBS67573_g09080 [Chytriomyces confervae]